MFSIDKEMSDRIKLLKVITIIMVVFIHSSTDVAAYHGAVVQPISQQIFQCFKYIFSQSISRAGVPTLFLISSVLLYAKEFTWLSNFKKKSRTILLPYLFWNTFWILISYAAQSIDVLASYYPRDSYLIRNYGITDWIRAYTYLNSSYPYLYSLWFLRDLFIMNLLAIVIKKLIDRFPKIIFTFIAVLWLSNTTVPYLDTQAIVFFVLGYYIIKYKQNLQKIDWIKLPLFTSIYTVSIFIDFFFAYSCPFLHNINVTVGILYFIRLTGYFINKKAGNIMLSLAKYTFIIYVLHEMSLSMLNALLKLLLPQTLLITYFEYLLVPAIIITLCILCDILMRKLIPSVYALATGSRS